MKYVLFMLTAIVLVSCASGIRWDVDSKGDMSGYTKAAHLSPDEAPKAP